MSKILDAYINQKKAIRTIIAKYRPNIADIEEISQDVFLTGFALESREEIREPDRLLLRIAKNLAVNDAKRKINKTSTSLEDSVDLSVYPDERIIPQEDALASRQKLAMFAEAVGQLPPELRRTLLMRKVEGLKFDQIALRLNITKSAVEKRIVVAMEQCERYMEAQGVSPRKSPIKRQVQKEVVKGSIAQMNCVGNTKREKQTR